MTYEEKVHYFGLRWLMNNSASVARLREFDTSRLMTIHEDTDEVGCSCDYDYEVYRNLVVPHVNGGTFSVPLPLTFAEVMKGILDAEPVEMSGVADLIMEGQQAQIEKLRGELFDEKNARALLAGELRTLKSGLASQTGLWTYLRNLYRDLREYTDGSTGLSAEELDELCAFLYRELDLWFNSAVGQETATLQLKVERTADGGK